jgi:anti-anti-sigma regulatory factor
MAIYKISEDILCVELPSAGSLIADELNTLNEMVSENCTCHVIIDFFRVEVLNSWNISTLLALRSLLSEGNRQLILCGVRVVTKCIFSVAGFRNEFIFAENRNAALAMLRRSGAKQRPR